MKRKLKKKNERLLIIIVLQFFFFQVIQLSKIDLSGYFNGLLKVKFFLNSVFGALNFSVGDVIYFILGIGLFYNSIRSLIYFFNRDKESAKKYLPKILLGINIFYFLFMLSFGLIYNHKNFPLYSNKSEIFTLKEYKYAASHLFNECRELRPKVSVDKKGDFIVDFKKMSSYLYKEQSSFYGIPKQKENIKISMYGSAIQKLGIVGYYNPFTGEAQVLKGIPTTMLPFTMAHEMGHQSGIAPEDEANFYSFYLGVDSSNLDFQYSVKYRSLFYLLREIYKNDSEYVKRMLDNFPEGMKRDFEVDKQYHAKVKGVGSDLFSIMNDLYLRANDQEGVVAYNFVAKMIVSYYKINVPSIFASSKELLNLPLYK